MIPPRYPTEYELHAFIDDELEPSRRAEVAAILLRDQVLARRVAEFRSDRDLLRAALGGIAGEPLPPAWTTRIEAATAKRPKLVTARRFAIAASVTLAVSVTAVVHQQRQRSGHTILTEAEDARDGRLDGRLAGDEPLPPSATRDAVLRSAVGMDIHAPDLRRFGFQLARIELFGSPGSGAAQLRYSDPGQRALTIYVRPSDGTVRFDIIRHGETRVCIWQDDVVGAVIMAPISAAEMLRIASAAYTDLNL